MQQLTSQVYTITKERLSQKLTVHLSAKHTVQPLLRFMQPLLKPTRLAMKPLMRSARPVLWPKASTMVEINFVIKPLSRLNKLELTTFVVGKPLLQVTKMQLLRFILTLSKLNL